MYVLDGEDARKERTTYWIIISTLRRNIREMLWYADRNTDVSCALNCQIHQTSQRIRNSTKLWKHEIDAYVPVIHPKLIYDFKALFAIQLLKAVGKRHTRGEGHALIETNPRPCFVLVGTERKCVRGQINNELNAKLHHRACVWASWRAGTMYVLDGKDE